MISNVVFFPFCSFVMFVVCQNTNHLIIHNITRLHSIGATKIERIKHEVQNCGNKRGSLFQHPKISLVFNCRSKYPFE